MTYDLSLHVPTVAPESAWYIGIGISGLGPVNSSLGGWQAYAYLFQKGDPFNDPARNVTSAVGYTYILALWNLEYNLKKQGYRVINLFEEELELEDASN